MRLHENKELFADAIQAASRGIDDGGLGIRDIFIEKDYWICRSLRLMALADTNGLAVHKGGTSLSKAYGIGARFSEDIDIADDPECREYLESTEFKEDFDVLLSHDRKLFAKPDGWQTKDLSDSPLITNLSDTWEALQETYNKEMPGLAYKSIPTVGQIQASIRTILGII